MNQKTFKKKKRKKQFDGYDNYNDYRNNILKKNEFRQIGDLTSTDFAKKEDLK